MTPVQVRREVPAAVVPVRGPLRSGAPGRRSYGIGGAPRRRDIEGLRAVAVLLVVLGHAGITRLAGGFVGVDVFFVISGFLITSLLVREAVEAGTVSLGRFWARRLMRLLPAASLVLAVTLGATWLWMSPVRVAGYATDGLASAAYATNIRLAVSGVDYFATAAPSPFQHFWSLAVEEQFYLLWPLIVVVTWLAWRRSASSRRRALAGVLATLTVVSFVVSIMEIRRAAPWGYFGLHSRAWELGVGALVALAAGRLARLPRAVAVAFGLLGLGAILAAAALYDESTPFPGLAATLPVSGAALIIAAGCARPGDGVGWLLGVPPMQVLGRLSYSWYLWHWPVLIIAPAALRLPASTELNVVLCLAALVPAALTYYLLEDPVRRRRSLVEHPVRGVLLGFALSGGTATLAVVLAASPPAVGVGVPAPDTFAVLAAAEDPQAALNAMIVAADQVSTVPANITPRLADAPQEQNQTQLDGCHLALTTTVSTASCVYGWAESPTTVVLFGDSHALQWFPAMQELAVRRGWRLVSLTRSACSPADIAVGNARLKRAYGECRSWRGDSLQRIRELAPQLVVVASSTNYRDALVNNPADPDGAWHDGWTRTLDQLVAASGRVAVLADTPFLHADPVDCLAGRGATVDACAEPAAAVLRDPAWRGIAQRAAERVGAAFIDPVPWICAARCPPVVGNVLVYHDTNHLSSAYATLLAPLLGASLPPA